MQSMYSNFGLIKRVTTLFVFGAIVTIGIVGFNLFELSELRNASKYQHSIEQRSDAIHEAVLNASRAATTLSLLGFDLTPSERKAALSKVQALLAKFDGQEKLDMLILGGVLDAEELKTLSDVTEQIHRSWDQINDSVRQNESERLQFHLISVVQNTERLYQVLSKADEEMRLLARSAANEVVSREAQARHLILIVLFAGISGLLLLGWSVLQYSVKRPLDQIIEAVSRIAGGDLTSSVSVSTGSHEIAAIVDALAIFRDNALARLRLENERSRDLAERELRRQKLENLISEFRSTIVEAVSENAAAVEAMRHSTKALARSVEDMQVGATQTTAASKEVSSNVADVATAAEQLSISLETMVGSIGHTVTAIEEAAKQANQATDTINKLSETAESIGGVASFIDTIARQTNLLALNATIEAARAGHAGRGFSVVATEVKSLAAQTTNATDNISGRIEEMRRRTVEAVGSIQVINTTSTSAMAQAATMNFAANEQNQTTLSITKNIRDAATWTTGLSKNVEDLASAVSRTKIASEAVYTASVASETAVDKFNWLVDSFLENVRAA